MTPLLDEHRKRAKGEAPSRGTFLPPLTPTQARWVADYLVADLFVCGGRSGKADRLALIFDDGRDWGGWSESAMAGRIARRLVELTNPK